MDKATIQTIKAMLRPYHIGFGERSISFYECSYSVDYVGFEQHLSDLVAALSLVIPEEANLAVTYQIKKKNAVVKIGDTVVVEYNQGLLFPTWKCKRSYAESYMVDTIIFGAFLGGILDIVFGNVPSNK